jgi:hypothetical protein
MPPTQPHASRNTSHPLQRRVNTATPQPHAPVCVIPPAGAQTPSSSRPPQPIPHAHHTRSSRLPAPLHSASADALSPDPSAKPPRPSQPQHVTACKSCRSKYRSYHRASRSTGQVKSPSHPATTRRAIALSDHLLIELPLPLRSYSRRRARRLLPAWLWCSWYPPAITRSSRHSERHRSVRRGRKQCSHAAEESAGAA